MSKEQPNAQKAHDAKTPKPMVQAAESAVAEADFADLAQVQRAADEPQKATPRALRGVQRAYGNQFVQRAVNGKGRKNGRQPIQTKLTVNEPDDVYEQEAERVAEALPTNSVATSPAAPNGNGSVNGTAKAVTTSVDGAVPSPLSPVPSPQLAPLAEQEAEVVADAVGQAHSAVPPVGGDEGGGEGNNNNSNGLQRTSSSQSLVPSSLSPTTPSTIRRGVPNQLRGALFNPAPASTPATNEVEMGGEETAVQLAEAGYVPPLGGGDEAPPPPEENGAQRAAVAGYDTSGAVDSAVESQIETKRGGGQSLPSPVQRQMEGHLGSDFSGVRVHTDGQSDQLNRSLNAEAFTTGNDVFFRQGAYEPGSAGGQKLIAHELTHVVQQGAAPVAKSPVQRERVNGEVAETAVAQRVVQRITGQRALRSVPFLSHQLGQSHIQLKSKEEKAREEAQQQADEGKSEAGQAKDSKAGDKDSIPDPNKESIDEKAKPAKTHKFQDKKPAKLETQGPVTESNLEFAEPQGDTGGIGWPDTKAEILPDWDKETQKYDDFKAGNFESMGLDLSGLKGDTTGIKVTDPNVKAAMVTDALAQGWGGDGDFLNPRVENIGDVMDMIPFGGENMAAEKLFSEGPGAWFGEVKDQIGKSFSEIGNSFGGMFEEGASGWARAASAMELVIAVLELIKKVLKILNVTFYIVKIVTKILKALAKLPFIGYLFKWAAPVFEKVAAVFDPISMTIFMIDQNVRTFRTLATAFLIIDMLYYESDPEKLMDRQARLTQHAQGMKEMSQDKVKKGVSDKYKDERKAEDMLVGAETLEDPQISPFTIEPPGKMEDGDKADYKQKFLNQYGVPDVADLAYNTLMEKSASLAPPPLVEYGKPQNEDIRYKIDRNAVAIVELRKQKAGLAAQTQQAEQAQEVAATEKKMFAQVDQTVQENKKAMEPHKQDMDEKLVKQAELKGDTTDTKAQGKQTGETGLNIKGFAGIIVKFIMFFMGPISKVGEKADDSQKQTLASGPSQQVETSSASVDASQKGIEEADTRTAETKQTQEEAKKSEGTLDETSQFLGEQQAEAQAGIDKLEEEKAGMQSDQDVVAAEEARLIDERTDLINEAVDWMDQWRMTREAIFTEIELALGKHFEDAEGDKDKKKEGEEGEDAMNEMKTDVYDREKDMGDMEGAYVTDHMGGADEADMDDEAGEGVE